MSFNAFWTRGYSYDRIFCSILSCLVSIFFFFFGNRKYTRVHMVMRILVHIFGFFLMLFLMLFLIFFLMFFLMFFHVYCCAVPYRVFFFSSLKTIYIAHALLHYNYAAKHYTNTMLRYTTLHGMGYFFISAKKKNSSRII